MAWVVLATNEANPNKENLVALLRGVLSNVMNWSAVFVSMPILGAVTSQEVR
jgi:hypothetical protein